MHRRFREFLHQEFLDRRRRNRRYSLRAFAQFLGTDHSTLSQILRERRPLPEQSIRVWARKLQVDPEETLVYLAAETLPDAATAARNRRTEEWTMESMAVLSEPAHWEMIQLVRQPHFEPDCRWVARHLAVSVDQVNVIFSRLLRLRLLTAGAAGQWTDCAPNVSSARDFRSLALARIKELSAR